MRCHSNDRAACEEQSRTSPSLLQRMASLTECGRSSWSRKDAEKAPIFIPRRNGGSEELSHGTQFHELANCAKSTNSSSCIPKYNPPAPLSATLLIPLRVSLGDRFNRSISRSKPFLQSQRARAFFLRSPSSSMGVFQPWGFRLELSDEY